MIEQKRAMPVASAKNWIKLCSCTPKMAAFGIPEKGVSPYKAMVKHVREHGRAHYKI
jgi:hypothetical protein